MHPAAGEDPLHQLEQNRIKKALEQRRKAIAGDADQLMALLQDLKMEMVKTDPQQVISVASIKKTDEIEKLAKKLKRDMREPI